MQKIKGFIKSYLLPEVVLKFLRPDYHGLLAVFFSWWFGNPASKLVVIGVTGTAGKSTTTIMLSQILNSQGKKCGYITTVGFFNGEQEFINKHGVSMPGGPVLQKQLKAMLDQGCQYAIVECTSEGLAQNRHWGIAFDLAIFTNLSQAHIGAHGSYRKYEQAKGKLFEKILNIKYQTSNLKSQVPKTIVVNLDDPAAGYFLSFPAQRHVGACFTSWSTDRVDEIYSAQRSETGFVLDGEKFEVKLLGKFNRNNALVAAVTAKCLGVSLEASARAIGSLTHIRGRMELVENSRGLQIFVDYGCEPAAFTAALKAASALPHKKLIHVFGATGGHRDKQKRFLFGEISAQYADEIIVTNDDVYDSNPEEIAKNIKEGIMNNELWKGSYEIILDRRAAIHRALAIAQTGDLILISGKGSEQFLVLPGNQRIEWDEVRVVKSELEKINNNQ